MPRQARIIAPGYPHHVIQRGNRCMPVFFKNNDYHYYLDLLKEWCTKSHVEIWAYCLMPNHVHLIAVPETQEGLRQAFSQTHKRYTQMINKREGWSGYLWQGRFSSFVMDESYTLNAARYIENNPVSAGLVEKPQDYRWSSVHAHLNNEDCKIVQVAPLLSLAPNWLDFLTHDTKPQILNDLQKHESTGRPLGSPAFVERIKS